MGLVLFKIIAALAIKKFNLLEEFWMGFVVSTNMGVCPAYKRLGFPFRCM